MAPLLPFLALLLGLAAGRLEPQPAETARAAGTRSVTAYGTPGGAAAILPPVLVVAPVAGETPAAKPDPGTSSATHSRSITARRSQAPGLRPPASVWSAAPPQALYRLHRALLI